MTQLGDAPILAAGFSISFTDFSVSDAFLGFLGDLGKLFDDPSKIFSTGGNDNATALAAVTLSFGSDNGNDILIADPNRPSELNGGDGDDVLIGGNSGDVLNGGPGNDVLFGGAGNDVVSGGAGDDLLIGGSGNGDDSYDGGEGVDTIQYTSAISGIMVDLSLGVADGVDIDHDDLSAIEHVIGGEGDDTLIGSTGDDTLVGDDGSDTLAGGAGNDILAGEGGSDTLIGGAGDDTLVGGGIPVDGGAVTDLSLDVADYSDATNPIAIDMTAVGTVGGASVGTVTGGVEAGTDSIAGVERILGTDGDDSFTAGSDFFGGAIGFVEFEGRGGNDSVIGNSSTRITYRSADTGVTVDLAAGTATGDLSVGSDSFTNVSQVVGSAHADTLTGSNATDDTLLGGDGADQIDGRDGFDTVDYSESGSVVTVDLSLGRALNDGFGKVDTLVGIEAAIGSGFGDALTGTDGDNSLSGNAGDDTLIGKDGTDTLEGGDGADLLDGGGGNDLMIGGTADGDSAIDTVDYSNFSGPISVNMTSGGTIDGFSAGLVFDFASGATDTIVGVERVGGTTQSDTFIVGGTVISDFTDYVEFEGGGGRDHLFGGAGDDTFTNIDASFVVPDDTGFGRLDGGGGFDLVDFTGETGSFNLTILRGDQLSGIENIDISGAGTVTLSLDVETVLSATDGTNALTGTENALVIDGNNGDVLNATGDWEDKGAATLAALDGYTLYQDDSTEAQIYIKDTDIGINILP